jgi:LmbE family N-acetylglucosaminyl deacetylase
VELVVDENHRGPSEVAWNARVAKADIRAFAPLRERRVVIVAPHPDDEVLGAAGLIQKALRERCLVEVIAVTDGEASHPDSTSLTSAKLATIRVRESDVALQRLGWKQPIVTRLHFPDGDLAGWSNELFSALADIILPDDLCVAPWTSDGHPDHGATGGAALRASREVGARSMAYLVWAWHWADPEGIDIPWSTCQRLDLGRRARAQKRWSTLAFQSQIRPLDTASGAVPVLPANVLRRFWRPYEIYLDETGTM